MIVFKYDTQTKEFIQELKINEAYGTNLPFATTVKPLAKKDGFAICFNGTKWEFVEDNRNKTVYVKDTKEELKVDYLGKIKDEHTLLVPKQFDKWDSKQNKWVEDSEAKELNRISLINQKANEVIEAKYPLYKQLNIRAKLIKDEDGSHYTDTDIEIMDMFIDAVRSIAKQAKINETPADEVDWSVLDNG